MQRWKLMSLSAAAAMALAACSSTPSSTTTAPATGSVAPAMNASATDQTLQAYHWDLERAEDQSGRALPAFTALAPKKVLRLGFSGDAKTAHRVSIGNLCNVMGAGYQLDGNKISITNPIGTMMACEPPLMQLEQAVSAQITRAESLRITQDNNAPRLTLQFNDGSRWLLKSVPTNATKYGSAGETMFYEVGPQTKPCNHGVAKGVQCLQVRELRYDGNGRKTATGDWQHFYGNIEGYQHTPGYSNVLRVKRYTIANPPADASRYAYVLDLTVETAKAP